MPEATITTEAAGRTITTKWWSNYMTPQTLLWILAAFVWAVIFWKDSRDTWEDVKELKKEVISLREAKADKHELEDINDKVTRQYSVQREQNEQTSHEIRVVSDWMNYTKGYNDALKSKK